MWVTLNTVAGCKYVARSAKKDQLDLFSIALYPSERANLENMGVCGAEIELFPNIHKSVLYCIYESLSGKRITGKPFQSLVMGIIHLPALIEGRHKKSSLMLN